MLFRLARVFFLSVECYVVVVLTCISPSTKEVEHQFIFLLENTCLCLLLIFLLLVLLLLLCRSPLI